MKNQYNFLKPIDTSSGSSDARSGRKQSASEQQRQLVKSGLSKLHNLVALKFAGSAGENAKQPAGANSSQQAALQSLSLSQNSSSEEGHRVAKLLSDSRLRAEARGGGGCAKREQRLPAGQGATEASRGARHQQRAGPGKQTVASKQSERISPELAKCYDEIDQIYDYIRGLAPLPVQLRKIKSIDFEQLEREKRLREQQAAERVQAGSPGPVPQALLQKVRQREASPTSAGEKASASCQPIRVTATSGDCSRPLVKRVESLNLGSRQPAGNSREPEQEAAAAAELRARKPAYLISGAHRGQLFRLPRAHSTSTLSKPKEVRKELPAAPTQLLQSATLTTHTLPGLRLSRVSIQPSELQATSGSLSRPSRKPAPGESRRPVESFLEGSSRSSSSLDGGSSQSSCSESSREAKSHSDYENDSSQTETSTNSAKTESDSSASEFSEEAARARRCSSSGNGTAGSGGLHQGSHSSIEEAPKASAEEHIYEQIPAHKGQLAGRSSERTPINYPTAYAANIAAGRPLPARRALLKQAPSAQNLQQLHQGASFPLPLPLCGLKPQKRGESYQRQAAALVPPAKQLDQRYRLSMNNLHRLYYQPAPAILVPYQRHHQSQLLAAAALAAANQQERLNRSSSSSKVNRPRPPRLSPAQFIAQIQVPRAASKRQEFGSQFTAGAQMRPQLGQPPKKQPLLLWRPEGQNAQPVAAYPMVSYQQQRRRADPRRLTAIGIEESLDFQRYLANQRLALARRPAEEEPKRALGKAYFEPGHLTEAPLIDQEAGEGSVEPEVAGQRRAASSGASSAASESRRKLPAHQQAAAFIQARCLNSISDLQSFSSSAEEEEEEEEQPANRSSSDDSIPPAIKSEPEKNFVSSRSFIKCYYGRKAERPQPAAVAPDAGKGESRKRIGRGKLLGLIGLNSSSSDNARKGAVEPGSVRQVETAGRTKEQAGGQQAADKEAQRQLRKRLSSGHLLNAEGPILVVDRRLSAPTLKQRHFEHPTVQVAEIPASSSPERLGLAGSLARELLSSSALNKRFSATKLTLEGQPAGSSSTTNSTSSYEAAIKNSPLEAALIKSSPAEVLQQQERRHSSAEARAAKKSSAGERKATKSSISGLIKVPRLSKQSHLLNRPLPKPPTGGGEQTAAGAPGGSAKRGVALALAASGQLNKLPPAAVLLAAGAPSSSSLNRRYGSQPAPASRLVSTNLDLEPEASQLRQPRSRQASALAEQSDLSLLNVSAPQAHLSHHSPTVTTCTSSGISSRLTAGTHLQSSAGSLGRRSLSGSKKLDTRKAAPFPVDGIALMDEAEQEVLEGCRQKDERAERDAERLELKRARQTEPPEQPIMSSNLKLFDEKFSSNFLDQHLASSNDSLLESINFSGTLNRKQKRIISASASKR